MRARLCVSPRPVTTAIGIRLRDPGGKSISTMEPITSRGRPCAGQRCFRNAGSRVDLADHAALSAHRLRDVRNQQVDPRDVQANGHRSALGNLSILRVDLIGHVDRRTSGGTCSRCVSDGRSRRRGRSSRAGSRARRAADRTRRRTRAASTDCCCAAPRRGSSLARRTSSSIVCTPSPTTCAGTRLAAAASFPLITSMR